jgi:uncharacterized protein (TIGR02001 family)
MSRSRPRRAPLALEIAAAATICGAGLARADVEVGVTGTSDYDFRGVSQTSGDAVMQVDAEYSARAFFASAFASPVDFGPAVAGDYEVDLVAGIARETRSGLEWRLAASAYLYPGAHGDVRDPLDPGDDVAATDAYGELSAGVEGGRFAVTLWHSPDLYGSGETGSYLDTALKLPLPRAFEVRLHAGYSFGHYFDSLEQAGGDGADYVDFAVGLARSMGPLDFKLTYVWTNTAAELETDEGPLRNDSRLILSATKPFALGERARR